MKNCEPLEVINKHIIPALNTVGVGFEEKKIYLPQLLYEPEAATAAFEKVKRYAFKRGDKLRRHCNCDGKREIYMTSAKTLLR